MSTGIPLETMRLLFTTACLFAACAAPDAPAPEGARPVAVTALPGGPALLRAGEADGPTFLYERRGEMIDPRLGTTPVNDPLRHRVIMQGGWSSGIVRNDTLEWDGVGWQRRVGAGQPGAKFGAASVYDARLNRTILFGGFDATSPSLSLSDNAVWEWNGADWERLATEGTPAPRGGSTLAQNAVTHDIWMFGGSVQNGDAVTTTDDLFRFDGVHWVQIPKPAGQPWPPARAVAAFAWDPGTSSLMLFGGFGIFNADTAGHPSVGEPRYDTWTWDGTTWTAHPTSAAPSGEVFTLPNGAPAPLAGRQTFVLDPRSGGLVLVHEALDGVELWRFDAGNWTQLAQPAHGGIGPNFRLLSNAFVDPISGDVVVTGGIGSQIPLGFTRVELAVLLANGADSGDYFNGQMTNEQWAFDGTAWRLRSTPADPGPRVEASAAFDELRGIAVLFGGRFGSATTLDDTWIWNGGHWAESSPATAPSARRAHGMAYDPKRKATVLFGGLDENDTALGDTWVYNGSWTKLTLEGGPEARSAHQVLRVDDGVLVFGGLTASGVHSRETWLLQSSPDAWVQLPDTSQGNSYDACAASSSTTGPYVFGGVRYQDDVATDDFIRWDPATTQWGFEDIAEGTYELTQRRQCALFADPVRRQLTIGGGLGGAIDSNWYRFDVDAKVWHVTTPRTYDRLLDPPRRIVSPAYFFDPRVWRAHVLRRPGSRRRHHHRRDVARPPGRRGVRRCGRVRPRRYLRRRRVLRVRRVRPLRELRVAWQPRDLHAARRRRIERRVQRRPRSRLQRRRPLSRQRRQRVHVGSTVRVGHVHRWHLLQRRGLRAELQQRHHAAQPERHRDRLRLVRVPWQRLPQHVHHPRRLRRRQRVHQRWSLRSRRGRHGRRTGRLHHRVRADHANPGLGAVCAGRRPSTQASNHMLNTRNLGCIGIALLAACGGDPAGDPTPAAPVAVATPLPSGPARVRAGEPVTATYAWTDRSDVFVPRVVAALADQPTRGRLLVYGGWQENGVRSDTWEWDGYGWIRREPLHDAGRRAGAVAVFDELRSRVLLVGGADRFFPNPSVTEDRRTYEWDGHDWSGFDTAHTVVPTMAPAAAWDPTKNRMLVFGGFGTISTVVDDAGVQLSETPGTDRFWQFDGVDWSEIPRTEPWPPPRGLSSMVWDRSRNRLVLFSGQTKGVFTEGHLTFGNEPGGPPVPAVGDTWEWDGAVWTKIPAPPLVQAGSGTLLWDPIASEVRPRSRHARPRHEAHVGSLSARPRDVADGLGERQRWPGTRADQRRVELGQPAPLRLRRGHPRHRRHAQRRRVPPRRARRRHLGRRARARADGSARLRRGRHPDGRNGPSVRRHVGRRQHRHDVALERWPLDHSRDQGRAPACAHRRDHGAAPQRVHGALRRPRRRRPPQRHVDLERHRMDLFRRDGSRRSRQRRDLWPRQRRVRLRRSRPVVGAPGRHLAVRKRRLDPGHRIGHPGCTPAALRGERRQ